MSAHHRFFYAFIIFFFYAKFTFAQCVDMDLGGLQAIAKAPTDAREAKILELGFDLRQTYQDKGATIRVYGKCWNGTKAGKPVFEQKLHWNQKNDLVVFYTYKEANFQALRQHVDQKHPTVAASPVVVGRMFKYTFGAERQENIDYFSVMVSLNGTSTKE
jgi:hypothetical protein